ncbi:hypothetical protein [Aliiglaciecola lipolytica]|uniref:Uncharacterized protein n=1 Tax=Aliiglaciecola lipolytica E3 TaxID=1127673 RepID=K6YNU7_9ALTE|nr:hypothetical protein [Aliiglaciecola lipolytica]GAC13025.1 hypothetical protein GLIP_0378 [Aliiglaciecola lipolytica E3]
MTTALIDTGIVLNKRLLLGILPVDALTREDLPFAITIDIEQPLSIKLSKHNSGRFSLAYHADLTSPIQIRIFDLQRRYVPRRLSIPVQTLAQILSIETAQQENYLQSRQRFPVLFPGAAYPINGRATGLRGKVLFNDLPVRWSIVELRSAQDATIVLARARGDDRGEFLILIPPNAVPDESLNQSVAFEILVYARATALPETNNQPHDPLWDLPVEVVVDVQPNDPVSSGEAIPPEYVASQTPVSVTFQLSHMLSSHDVDDIVFNPP